MKQPNFDDYAVTVRPLAINEGGGYLASIAEIPGCTSDGKTHEEAIAHLREAFDDVLAALRQWDQPVPAGKAKSPASFVFRPTRSLYAQLKATAEHEGVSVNALLNEAVALRLGASLGTEYLYRARKVRSRARA